MDFGKMKSSMTFTGPRSLKSMIALGLAVVSAGVLGWMAVRRHTVQDRVYKIGFENQPPQHYVGEDGKPTGLAVELISEAARRRGIRLQWLLEPESSEVALTTKKVDLWPMMTIRPERKGIVYITDPYRENAACMIVRTGSAYSRLEDLRNASVSYDGSPLDLRMLQPLIPNARFSAIESPRERLEAICEQRFDAAYFDEYTAITTLLDGISCSGQRLRVIRDAELNGQLGVGATFEARPAADAIREEIGAMAADGTLGKLASRWRSFSGRNLEIADDLMRSQRRERWLIAGIAGAILLLMFTLWQAAGIRRALASAREATELKSQFLANMSHEIRTPMNAILGMTAIAIETPDREEQREYLGDVMRSGESLLALLNDILDFSKFRSGTQESVTYRCFNEHDRHDEPNGHAFVTIWHSQLLDLTTQQLAIRTIPRPGDADPLTISTVVMTLVVVGAFACTVPALRATRVDPMSALRHQQDASQCERRGVGGTHKKPGRSQAISQCVAINPRAATLQIRPF